MLWFNPEPFCMQNIYANPEHKRNSVLHSHLSNMKFCLVPGTLLHTVFAKRLEEIEPKMFKPPSGFRLVKSSSHLWSTSKKSFQTVTIRKPLRKNTLPRLHIIPHPVISYEKDKCILLIWQRNVQRILKLMQTSFHIQELFLQKRSADHRKQPPSFSSLSGYSC